MPSLVPTSVGLSPLVSAALTSAAAAATSPMNTPPAATDPGTGGSGGTAGAAAGGPTYPLNAGITDQGVDMTGTYVHASSTCGKPMMLLSSISS